MKLPSRILLAAATLVAASSAHAADGTWTADANGTWSTTTNWAGGTVADGSGFTAFFTNDITADRTVTLGAPQTIGNLVFDDAGATGDSAWTITGSTLTLAGGTPTITTHTNATIASILAGTAGLTKAGTGTLTLSGANTYTGGTTISEGLLRVNAQSYPKDGNNRTTLGAMSVASGATLELINTGTAGSYGAPGVIVVRDLTLSGAGTVVTSGTGVTDFWDGNSLVNLKAFTGTFHATSGTMAFQINATRMSGVNAMILDSGAYLDLRTDGGIALSSLTGTGTVGSSYTANQVLTVGATDASSQFDGVIQNTVPGFTNAPTIALRKIGTGTLTLTGANTYTGSTTINGGTLDLGGGTATGSISSGSALVLGGGTLAYTRTGGTTQTFNGTTINAGVSAVSVVAGNTVNLGAITRTAIGGTVDFGATGSIITSTANTNGILGGYATFGGNTWAVANGASAITGLATYTTTTTAGVTAANYAAGNIDVDGSVALDGAITPNSLRFNTAAANTLTLTGTNTISGGGILVTGAVGNNLSTITGGTLVGAAGKDLVVIQNNTANSLTIGSIIANNGTATALTKTGAGTLVLSGANTYTGGTTVYAGTLVQDLSARSGAIANIGAFTVNSGAVYELRSGTDTGADSTLFQNNALIGTGTVRKTGVGYIGLAHTGSNLNAFDGTFDVQAGTIGVNSGTQGSGKATVGLNVSGTKLDIRTGTFLIDALNGVTGSQVYVSHTTNSILSLGNNNGSGIFNGTLDNGGASRTLALIKNGTGTQTLAGANTFTGGLTVNGGTLNYTGGGSVTGAGGNVLIGSGATLNLSGTTTNQLEATGTWTVNGTLANTSNKAISIRTTSVTLNGGTINSTQAVDTVHGAFFSYLNTTITANGTGNVISGNGDLGINTGTTLTLGTALAGDRLLVSTVLKNVSGAGAVTKTGLGTVTLTAANLYTGLTTISAGTLLANNVTGSGLGSGAVAVNAGTLGGTGFITGGTITVASGATLQGGVGAASGTLTIGSNVTLSADSIIRLALGDAGASSTLARTGGTWTFDANQTFNLIDLGVTEGGIYTLITGLTGSEAGLSTIATDWHNTSDLIGTFSLSGNNVIFTAVPEPSTYGLIGAGALAAAALVRRRRKHADAVAA